MFNQTQPWKSDSHKSVLSHLSSPFGRMNVQIQTIFTHWHRMDGIISLVDTKSVPQLQTRVRLDFGLSYVSPGVNWRGSSEPQGAQGRFSVGNADPGSGSGQYCTFNPSVISLNDQFGWCGLKVGEWQQVGEKRLVYEVNDAVSGLLVGPAGVQLHSGGCPWPLDGLGEENLIPIKISRIFWQFN